MRCVDPFVKAGEVYPCGKCLPCRKMKAWAWCSRIILEASQHDFHCVVTLTYDETSLPVSGELSPRHLCTWLKRFRACTLERYPWRYVRFYACAEYGENTGRPHYHVVLFGQPGCERGRSGRLWCSDCGCSTCEDIASTWSVGASSVDKLTKQSAAYVAGYVTRKLEDLLVGKKQGPFTRMSLRPGIGAGAMDDVASSVLQYKTVIPSRLGGPSGGLVLDRYLRKRLAERTDQELYYVPNQGMQMVRAYAWEKSISQKKVYRQLNETHASVIAQRAALKEKVL